MFLDARLRRLTTYLYVQDLLAGAHVLEVGSESSGDFLRARQARSVGRATADGLGGLPAGEFDVAFALDVEAGDADDDRPRRCGASSSRTAPWCWRWRAATGRARAAGASYYELSDLLEPMFPSVKLVGQAPFVGATLVEYGAADPDPVLDGTLVPKGERVEWYVVVARAQARRGARLRRHAGAGGRRGGAAVGATDDAAAGAGAGGAAEAGGAAAAAAGAGRGRSRRQRSRSRRPSRSRRTRS